MNNNNQKVSELVYVYEGHVIPILEKKAFDSPDDCLNFTLKEISKNHEIID